MIEAKMNKKAVFFFEFQILRLIARDRIEEVRKKHLIFLFYRLHMTCMGRSRCSQLMRVRFHLNECVKMRS